MKKIILMIITVILVMVMGYSIFKVLNFKEKESTLSSHPHTAVGKNMKNIKIQSMDEQDDTFKNYLTKDINVINFWASWCTPCNNEMPELVNFNANKPANVSLTGINIQDTKQGREAFLKKYHADYKGVIAPESVLRDYKIIVIPTTLFLDKEGKVLKAYIGEINEEKLNYIIKEIKEG